MEGEAKEPLGCRLIFGVFSLALIGIPLYVFYLFFNGIYQYLKPDVLARGWEGLKTLLLCFGGGSLFIWLVMMMPAPKIPWREEDPFEDNSPWYRKLYLSPVVLLMIFYFEIIFILVPFVAFYTDVISPRLKKRNQRGAKAQGKQEATEM